MRAILSAIKLLALSLWSIVMAVVGMLGALFTFKAKYAVLIAQKIWTPVVLLIFGTRIKVKGIENLDKKAHYVIMANHSSFIDIPVLFRSLPIQQYYVAKKELRKVPVLGWYVMASGMIFIDRSNRVKSIESLNKAAVLINNGRHVVIFPEGTATRTGEIGEFKKGGFHLAMNSKATILPIRIKGTGAIWPRGRMFNLRSGNVEVIIGKGMSYEEYSLKPVEDLALETRKIILELS
jgi:1-acyl-sn-glycerol-3-phosphate acyltransferase